MISYAKTHTAYPLLDYANTDLGDYYVHGIDWQQVPSVCQTIRSDLPSDSPIYQVNLELYS